MTFFKVPIECIVRTVTQIMSAVNVVVRIFHLFYRILNRSVNPIDVPLKELRGSREICLTATVIVMSFMQFCHYFR